MLDRVGGGASLTNGDEGRKSDGLEQLKVGSLRAPGAGSRAGCLPLIWHPGGGAEWAVQDSALPGDHGWHLKPRDCMRSSRRRV